MELSKKEQLYTVKRVLEEMEIAEECMKRSGFSWTETYLQSYCPELDYHTPFEVIDEIEKKYDNTYLLTDETHTIKDIGIPLKTVTLSPPKDFDCKNINDSFEVEFGTIKWHTISSNKKQERDFIFNNNGIIEFNKLPSNKSKYSYGTSFDVKSHDFSLMILCWKRDKNNYSYDQVEFRMENQNLTLLFNNIGETVNVVTGETIMEGKRNRFADVNIAKESALEIIKSIKGELPLVGLVERVNNGLNFAIAIKNRQKRR